MTKRLLEQLPFFKDRRVVYDPEESGSMQIFQTVVFGSESEAIELHTFELFLALIYGIPTVQTEPCPMRTMAGLIFLAAQAGKLPQRAHVSYLTDRWFKRVSGGLVDVGVDHPSHDPHRRYPDKIVTECCLVVDEWKEETERPIGSLRDFEPEVSRLSELPSAIINLGDLNQNDRQRLYETLHRQYGCRIY